MARLNAEQEAALERVRAAQRVHRTARSDAEAEARRMVERRLDDAGRERSRAVRHALELKVPRSRVGAEGIGTKDWGTIDRILAVTAGEVAAEAAVLEQYDQAHVRELTGIERERWPQLKSSDTAVRVDWPDYHPVEGGDLDTWFHVPVIPLHGVVQHDAGEWLVLEDDLKGRWAGRAGGPLQDACDYEAPVQAALNRVLGQ